MQNRILTKLRCLAVAGCAVPLSAASGQEFFIGNGDSAALIAAIIAANADPAPATIHLASNGSYVLTSVQHGASATGTPQMTSEITINGNGSTVMRSFATGTPDFRIFIASASGEVTINDLTITNGFNRQGAGIYNDGTMTLNNVTVTANEGPSGGGIANTGPLTLIGCSVINNNSGSNGGGGIFSQGANADLTVIDSVISGNTLSASAGGGIRNQPSASATGGVLTIIDSVISDNSAMGVNGSGGGISNSGFVTITGSTISGNETVGTGGGISSTRTVDIVDSVITENSANNGGGLYNSIGHVTITDSEITDNTAESLGGGLYSTGTSSGGTSLTVTNSIVAGNSAEHGGGIYNFRPMVIEDSLIEGNLAVEQGGGIAHDNNSVDLVRSTVRGNTAGTHGGGITNGSGGSVTIEQSTITANHADADGGGVHIFGLNTGRTELINSTVSGNSALGDGGGIHNKKTGADKLVLVNSTVYANSADEGGGIRNTGSASGVVLSNSIVAGSTGGDIVGNYVDVIYNLVQDGAGLTNPTSMSGDPMLGPLEDNGGATLTHAPAFNSIAVDAGDCSVSAGGTISPVTVDQRGEDRPKGAACDIGAVEYFCAPDINGDGVVDADDFFEFLSLFAAGDPRADFNADGVIDADDFFAFLSAFAAGC